MNTLKLALLFVTATAGVATAGGSEGSVGVGAEYQLNGTGGASFNYDAGKFHVGAFLGLEDPENEDNTDFSIGARFYYHVASTAMSDFSVGGSVGLFSDGVASMTGGDGERFTNLYIEPGFQIRAFVASNVALSFTGGLVIRTYDDGGVDFGAQATGIAGVHYYFFGQ